MPTLKNAPELFEVIYGSPKCRYRAHLGGHFESRPHLPLAPLQGPLPWRYYPWKLRICIPKLLRAAASLCALTSVILFGTLFTRANAGAWSCLVLLNLLLTTPLLYLAYIIDWNYRLREGLCWAQGKAAQARAQWGQSSTPETAKHPFFEWRVADDLRIVVLNDGSQEVWCTGGAELQEDLATALGVIGFVSGSTSLSEVGVSISNSRKKHSDDAYRHENPYTIYRKAEKKEQEDDSASV